MKNTTHRVPKYRARAHVITAPVVALRYRLVPTIICGKRFVRREPIRVLTGEIRTVVYVEHKRNMLMVRTHLSEEELKEQGEKYHARLSHTYAAPTELVGIIDI